MRFIHYLSMRSMVITSLFILIPAFYLSSDKWLSLLTTFNNPSKNEQFEYNSTNRQKIAVLIDGGNAERSLISEYISEAGRFGKVTVKRIYADWTHPEMKSWKEKLNSHAIRPIQKFSYTKAKSSTDTALIIDAMDLLHSELVDGFCIVSSDSDYTGLAHRIREEGLFIMGIGNYHTPEAFVKSCESFTYSEILAKTSLYNDDFPTTNSALSTSTIVDTDSTKSSMEGGDANLRGENVMLTNNLTGSSDLKIIDIQQVHRAFRTSVDIDTGMAHLSRLSDTLRSLDPTFDPRNYGYSSFRKFADALSPYYEKVLMPDGSTIKIREKKTT